MNKKGITKLFVLAAVLVATGCDQAPRDVDKPKETISLERAQQMYAAYQDRFNALTEFRGGKEDARYGWHSIEFYKNYIAYLEQASKKVKIEISGLRLYYVAYPDDDRAGDHRDYQTYFFVPTYFDKKTNTHIAFDPLHVDEQGNPLPIHDMITKGKGRVGMVSKLFTSNSRLVNNETESSIANMGQMCKPNCSE
jgi:hypothetical protein